MRLILASRKSDLARIQAYAVGQALQKAHPQIEIDYQFRESMGDKNLSDPLWKMPERGVFTEDFYQDLIAGHTDLVVHSWKDLPVETRAGTEIIATMLRADARDILIVKKSAWSEIVNTEVLKIFSSSPRRAYNLNDFLKEALPTKIKKVEFESVRGNIPTRFRKLMTTDSIHGLVVAKAALDRLLSASQDEFLETKNQLLMSLKECRWMVLPLKKNPTAAAQGALAIEIRKNHSEIKKLLAAINCHNTFQTVSLEREILKSHGGGCHQKIGVTVLKRPYGQITFLQGLTEQDKSLDSVTLVSSDLNQFDNPKDKVTRDKVWPLETSDVAFFERENLNIKEVSDKNTLDGLLISKADALPQNWNISHDKLVWAAGLETWKKLAQKGVWVWGCAEGLGESEDPALTELMGAKVGFLRLTHADADSITGTSESLATYKLVPKVKDWPDLTGKTHFYWMSGSAFLRAMEIFPELIAASHSCGPGHTYQVISERLKGLKNPCIFLSHQDWLKQVTI
ncbi:MAG: hydroxymethylbilane synthase [Oligoflexia bacterium]|nr:hydroxymethylbilane synthase [Oligoflexia bacterium]